MEGEQNLNNVWIIISVLSLELIGYLRTRNVQGEAVIEISFPKIVRAQLEPESDDLPNKSVQSQRCVYDMRQITLGSLVYFSIQ